MSPVKFKILNKLNNPTSIHGIYPYRGKISSIEAKLVVEQLPPSATLLDPFCGSGTIIFEGMCRNLVSYGIDNNPLAVWLSKGKISSLSKDINRFLNEAETLIGRAKKSPKPSHIPSLVHKHFHPQSAIEIMSMAPLFDEMSDYLKAVFLGSIALTARGCNQYKWTSSTVGKDINPKRYIPFFEKFFAKIKKHYPNKNIANIKSKIFLSDSRKLSNLIPAKSIDFVFTSPPYFDGLDYTAYYGKIVYSILGADRNKIKEGLIQKVEPYEKDMKAVFDELLKVTKDNAQIIFVVGDKKIKNRVINGGDFFSNIIHHKPNQIIEREYTGTSSQVFDKLNKTKRKEQIVVWDKSTW